MVASFLHHFPQYTLQDLEDGTLTLSNMLWLHAGMLDNTVPQFTEPVEDQVSRQVRDAALRAHEKAKKGGGW